MGRGSIPDGNLTIRPSYSHATSADAGVELQIDVSQPAPPNRHLVRIGPRQERRRFIGRHGIGSRLEMDQEASLRVALESGDDLATVEHLESGFEGRGA